MLEFNPLVVSTSMNATGVRTGTTTLSQLELRKGSLIFLYFPTVTLFIHTTMNHKLRSN
jgi:hypothetical protein